MIRGRGASLVEILVVIGILALISVLTYETYVTVNANKALDTDAQKIVAELAQARSLSVGSRDGSRWGVHLASTSVTLFEGSAFTVGASGNVITSLNSVVQIDRVNILGGGTDIVFQRLTGATSATGTMKLIYTASSTVSRTITIYGTGISDAQ